MPWRRQYAAATAVDGEVWYMGGLGPDADWAGNGTKVYDPARGAWKRGPGLLDALHHAMAVTYRGKVVLLGGFIGPGVDQESDRVLEWRDNTWRDLPRLQHPRGAAAAAVVDDKIVVVGGTADGELVAETEAFDGERWTDAAPILTPRDHLGAASDDQYVYAIGGKDLSSDLPTLERYDPVADRWEQLPAMPTPSDGLGAAYVDGRLITVGGESTESASDAVQAYDIRKQTWSSSQLPKVPSARHGVAVTMFDDAVYALGGATKPKHAASSNAAEVLDLTGGGATVPPAAQLEWEPIRDAPSPRQYAAAAAVPGTVYLIGGMGETASDETAEYDPVLNRWTDGPPLPQPSHHLMAVTYEDEVVVMGGVAGGDDRTSTESDQVYALQAGTWEELPRLKHPRAAAAAAVVDSKIVVVGGYADRELVAETEVFDGDRWTDAAPILTPREHLGAASDDRYLYAVGGRDLSTDLRTLERYDPDANRWEKLKPMPSPSDGLGAAYADGRLITVGGESSTSASDAVWAYDIRKEAWSSQVPNLPSARHGVAVTALDDAVYAIGGATRPTHVEPTTDATVLDFD